MREGSENGWDARTLIPLPVSKEDERRCMRNVAGHIGMSVEDCRLILDMIGLLP